MGHEKPHSEATRATGLVPRRRKGRVEELVELFIRELESGALDGHSNLALLREFEPCFAVGGSVFDRRDKEVREKANEALLVDHTLHHAGALVDEGSSRISGFERGEHTAAGRVQIQPGGLEGELSP